jgi:hypothetical protein
LKELKGFIRGILLDPETLKRPWYNGAAIERMAKCHFAGFTNITYELDKIVSLELWLRQNGL